MQTTNQKSLKVREVTDDAQGDKKEHSGGGGTRSNINDKTGKSRSNKNMHLRKTIFEDVMYATSTPHLSLHVCWLPRPTIGLVRAGASPWRPTTSGTGNWCLVPAKTMLVTTCWQQYRHDCEAVANAAIEYAKGLKLGGDGKDVAFDIDDHTLSNLPYYARSDVAFGAKAFNSTKFNAWVIEGKAPAIPAILGLYKVVLSLGIKPVIITGTPEFTRQARINNLKNAGYTSWLKLILKEKMIQQNQCVQSSKRTELVKAGYRIVGNTEINGLDLIGENPGARTFKVPDPMYYIG
ncbi:hypothetical protein HAX54_045356 [Datura stramonium]|uniref:Uncharacterized protein n=1 Tax=Datura stramonium TaxID=4076 RepID=A0ABS8WFM0_DATST|nr:hypothetical protein [Datura stramonium]